MNKNDIKKQLFDHLTPLMRLENYKAEKGNDRFIQKTDFGFRAVSYNIVQRQVDFELTFFAEVRFDSIENIWHEVSQTNPQFQNISPTILIEMGNIPGVRVTSLHVSSESSCEIALKNFFKEIYPVMKEEIFNKVLTLEEIDHLFNTHPETTSVYMRNLERRAIKGIIVAQLLGKTVTLKSLEEKYRTQISQSPEIIQQKLEQIINR